MEMRTIIKANDENLREIVKENITKWGSNADLNHIDVSQVTDMSNLFSPFNINFQIPLHIHSEFMKFNGDISLWDVTSVISMRLMFHLSIFNGDISNWNVSNVQNMEYIFYKSQFNSDISKWNINSIKSMTFLFYDSQFNGDLSNWNVKNVTSMIHVFKDSPLEGREPWWYVLSSLFGSPYLMYDSMDFGWINLERKVIYGDKLIKTLKRGYNTQWNGELPNIPGFEIYEKYNKS